MTFRGTRGTSSTLRLHFLTFVLQALVITGVGLEVTLSPSMLTVFEGEDAKFTCFPLIPLATPLLHKNNIIVSPQNFPRLSYTDNTEALMDGNRTYTLQDIEISDNGTEFTCTVAGFVSNTITMSVYVLPQITGDQSGLVTILENDSTPRVLNYKTFGVPQPHSYQWLRDGAPFQGNSRVMVTGGQTSTLEVRQPSREDSASYTLVATSTAGHGTLTVELQIAYDEYIEFPLDQEVPVGATVTFRCVHRFGWSYIWRSSKLRSLSANDDKVSINLSGTSLQYGPVDVTDHLTDFYCVSRLAIEHYFTSPTAILRVLSPTVVIASQNYTVVEGSDVVITFDLSGHPSPHSFLYFFNDIQLRVDEADSRFKSVADRDGSLLIRDVRRNNSGVYSLTARNSLGEDTAHTHLIVQYSPIIAPHQVSIVLQVNRMAEVTCGEEIMSFPPASFSWMRNFHSYHKSQFNVDQTNGSLLLNPAKSYDSGTWICTAKNSVGVDKTLVMVLVLDPPHPPKNLQVLETGATWAALSWSPPDYVGPLTPLSMYEISASPHQRNHHSNTFIKQSNPDNSIPSNHPNDNSSDLSLSRGFDPNTTCVEVLCEVKTVRINSEFMQLNLTGLVPALSYNVVVRALSNGTRLISEESDNVIVTTKPDVPHIGSVVGAVYGPGEAHVSWTLAFSGGLPVKFFEIDFRKINNSFWQSGGTYGNSNLSHSDKIILPDFRSWIVNELEAEEYYLFRVRAFNELGYGNYTTSLSPMLSHRYGVPSAPLRPVVTGWAEDFAVINSSVVKLGRPQAENFTVSVILMQNGDEVRRQMIDLSPDYAIGSQIQLTFLNLSYRGDWQFTMSCSNDLGESIPSRTSLHARDTIQEVNTAYAVVGPVMGCLLGVLNMAALTMVIILFAVMTKESLKQQRNMARRVEMAQVENDSPPTQCPFNPQCLIYRSSPDGRSSSHVPPSETVYADIPQRTCPMKFLFPTSTSSVSAV